LTVDLCSLCLRVNDPSMAMLISTALFGDGAAAIVLRKGERRSGGSSSLGRVLGVGDHFWPDTEHIMGWDVRPDGFGVVLSVDLPQLLRRNLMPAMQGFLDRSGMDLGEFAGFPFHPGGSKVLRTVQAVLGLSEGDLAYSWETLRNFGNMSSPTALFALHRAVR